MYYSLGDPEDTDGDGVEDANGVEQNTGAPADDIYVIHDDGYGDDSDGDPEDNE